MDMTEINAGIRLLDEGVQSWIQPASPEHVHMIPLEFIRIDHFCLLVFPPGVPTRRAVFPAVSLDRTVKML